VAILSCKFSAATFDTEIAGSSGFISFGFLLSLLAG
jgi:hypothetical protein